MKYQLKSIIASISSEAQKVKNPKVKERYYKLKRISESPKDMSKVCRIEGVSRGWVYKWVRRLKKKPSIESLYGLSKKPLKSPNKTRRRIEKKVCKIRRAQPYLGAERIQEDLKRIYKEDCPRSTVNNILRRNNFISKDKAKKLTKKHLGKLKHPSIGYLQMDFKYVPYKIQNKQFYQLSCVDHSSSWRLIRSFSEKSQDSVLLFLNELVQVAPFPIIQIQTDNDTAFTDKYSSKQGAPTGSHAMDRWCLKHGIEHKLIPLGEKELNGKVENTHKQDDREFYSQGRHINEYSLRINIQGYNDRWNTLRRTKRNQFKTPEEIVLQQYIAMIAWVDLVKKAYSPSDEPIVKLDKEGNLYVKTKPPKKKKKNKTTKKSVTDRYMEYVNWDEKNRAS